jgi:hypothetical protein
MIKSKIIRWAGHATLKNRNAYRDFVGSGRRGRERRNETAQKT